MALRKRLATAVFIPALTTMLLHPAAAGTRQRPPTSETPPKRTRPAYSLENCDLPTVLKMLANEARVELDLDFSIRGTVNMQLEDVDAKQAIEVLSQANALDCQLAGNVYHIKATAKTDDAHKGGEKPADGFEAFGQALAKTINDASEAVTKPEIAERFAKYKHNYYLALIKEGFTAQEALNIVIASGDPGFPSDQKGK